MFRGFSINPPSSSDLKRFFIQLTKIMTSCHWKYPFVVCEAVQPGIIITSCRWQTTRYGTRQGKVKVRVKFVRANAIKAYRWIGGRAALVFNRLDLGEWPDTGSGRLIPGKEPDIGWVDFRFVLDSFFLRKEKNSFPLQGFESRTAQPLAYLTDQIRANVPMARVPKMALVKISLARGIHSCPIFLISCAQPASLYCQK